MDFTESRRVMFWSGGRDDRSSLSSGCWSSSARISSCTPCVKFLFLAPNQTTTYTVGNYLFTARSPRCFVGQMKQKVPCSHHALVGPLAPLECLHHATLSPPGGPETLAAWSVWNLPATKRHTLSKWSHPKWSHYTSWGSPTRCSSSWSGRDLRHLAIHLFLSVEKAAMTTPQTTHGSTGEPPQV